ncbi:xanthine dehydrogenase/oxidase-like [Wyeomyia smithii]|uniref:xanthine dehydrogenase/oxidase-like n=1 Tax=Wyeomyia smithii TaxID=174621 RepID=UPI002467BD93|nr:xanthine dehydrogenase/oxidase-like [Wyeomyia smithii]
MDIVFTINGTVYKVNPTSVPIDTTLNTFIRNYAHLSGTKFMCLEGGCGACIVNVNGIHPVTKQKFSWAVNSCLFPVLSCHGLDVVTVEGIGDKQDGYHPTQKALAYFNGTQCGYCSPGMVMNMYSLLESKQGKVTMDEVENAFGGNICRCTGYRPILEAFKSLAIDAEPRLKEACQDIEDLTKICPKTGVTCSGKCSAVDEVKQQEGIHFNSADGKEWHKVYNITDVFAVLEKIGSKPYMLVAGNTAHGVYRNYKVQVFVDINSIEELRSHSCDNRLTIGANVSLTELMTILTDAAAKTNNFKYCLELVKHIDLIANVPVRNTGTIAGNLCIKNQHKEFPSDLYLILEAVGAKLTIAELGGKTKTVTPAEFVSLDMNKKIILNIILPPLSSGIYKFRSLKIMPRAQNAHAYVNGAFLFKFSADKKIIDTATICFGGINPDFTHALQTEKQIAGKNIFSSDTFQAIIRTLSAELEPDWVLPDASPAYRKNLAISLFYKATLSVASEMGVSIEARFRSGGTTLERPLSTASQRFDTYKENWPLTKNVPKIEGLAQTSGEAKYANDMPTLPNELYAAFVLGTKPHAKIEKIVADEALKLPGVVAFFSAKDIPGTNNFMYFSNFMGSEIEEVFASETVHYHGQPVGLIVAKSHALANRAAGLVKITYSLQNSAVVLSTAKEVLRANAQDRIKEMPYSTHGENYDAAPKGDLNIKGHFEIGGQYHYYMETQTCVCIPIEDGMDVYSSTQWVDLTQMAIARVLKVPQNSLNLYVRRLGGGYGGKGTRATLIACACALAAQITKRPVRFVMSLEANMKAIGKRYPVISDYEVEVSKTGKIVKLYNEYVHDFGYNWNESMGHAGRFFSNCYDDTVFKTVAKGAKTDCASNTWCRAPGTTEGVAMIENIMEHVAFATGLDPLEVRMANMPKDMKMLEIMPQFRADVEFDARRKEIDQFNKEHRWRKRGIAIVPMRYPQGYFGSLHAIVSVYHDDGTVAISHGGIEMGQGMNTKAAQVAAHILGISLDKISIKPTNNLTSPNDICSGGSMTSETVSYAVKRACEILLERFKPIRDEHKDVSWEELIEKCHAQSVDLCATYMYKASDLAPYIIWGLSCSEVEVDILTGNVQLRRVDILEDVGESLSPGIDVGQIEGSFVMGIGYYLTEALVFDPKDGALLTDRTWTYKPPGAKDIPVDFRIRFMQNSSNQTGVLRSKATGEPAMNMTISVIFALRYALLSARKDAGLPAEWISLGAPSTPDQVFLLAGNSVEQLKIN